MGEQTQIEWTSATWNPFHGCLKISPGCKNCYMYRDKKRYGQDPMKVVRSKTTFNAPLKWSEPSLIFTCSWSDWFIEQADAWRDDAYDVIRATPQHTYQILTKRIERAEGRWPINPVLQNAWLGVSVESRDYLHRINILRATPAKLRFLSLEPLLGDLGTLNLEGIDWVIMGGESGPDARPTHPNWFRSIRDQVVSAGIPLFFKQWGEYCDVGSVRAPEQTVCAIDGWSGDFTKESLDEHVRKAHGGEISCPPFQLMHRVGKKNAGAELDGREWRQMPILQEAACLKS